MTALTHFPTHRAVFGFAAGALAMAFVTLVGTRLAQSPGPDMQGMIEWCRQMMGQAGAMMQGTMSGMCMMGR